MSAQSFQIHKNQVFLGYRWTSYDMKFIISQISAVKFTTTQLNSHHPGCLWQIFAAESATPPRCFTWISCSKHMKMDLASFCSCMTS